MTEAEQAVQALAKAQVLRDQDACSKALDQLIDVAMREAEQRYPAIWSMPMGKIADLMLANIPVLRHVPKDLVALRIARRAMNWKKPTG